MKKFCVFILILAMMVSLFGCTGSSENLMESIEAREELPTEVPADIRGELTAFGVNLFRESYEDRKNTLISPLSVLYALSMTANGAKGETLSQMEEVLGADVDTLNAWLKVYMEALNTSKDGKLNLANGIWFKDDPTLTIEEAFLQTNADYYSAGIYKAAFDEATRLDINKWVEKHTDGMIKDILDKIPEDAVMYLVNALAFDALWQDIYKDSQIQDGKFTTEAGAPVDVELMWSTEGTYLNSQNATGFLKYYEGRRFAFAALLPEQGMTVQQYLDTLTGEDLADLLDKAENAVVQTAIPKFKADYSVEMSDILKDLGMTDAFDGTKADLTGIGTSEEGNLCIGRVLHKTYIQVDGKGTKAGAATAVEIIAETAMEYPEPATVILDRPFVYMLIDCEKKLPFFIGAMMDPSGKFEQPELGTVPDLTVTDGDYSYTVSSGDYSWNSPDKDGLMCSVIACGSHPLENVLKKEFTVINHDVLNLSFPVMPDAVYVRRWPGAGTVKPDAEGELVNLENLTLILQKGDWVYEITAHWQKDTWSGEASYHLYLSR